ncbi:MAG: CPBP family intramembrane metalloprotease [Acidobacteriaceae bacterium]|nr:CPBP family intramembrane metalloprotease [Acidobacteriaceae bacterium]
MSGAFPAFSLEAAFYLASMFEQTRAWFSRVSSRRTQGAMLWISALLPYLAISLATASFQRNAFYLLAMLCGIFAFWYVYTPRRVVYDVGFLVIAAAPVVERVFGRIYPSPEHHLRLDILGHLMWIRLGIMALLVLREWDPGPLSPWPQAHEWKAGFLYFVVSVVPIALAAIALHDVRFVPRHDPWWRIAVLASATFFGILWVVALGEELFFRGVVERAIYDRWNSPTLAVLISAAIFGCAHLWFHQFPDWRRACVAALLGIACGIAYLQTGSIRAPMVTHAFIVATWRVFFR